MYNRLISFIGKHNSSTDVQHGFRKCKSTHTACKSFTECTLEALDNCIHTVGIFLDRSRAYSVLNHQILLHKLEVCGIRETANLWFESYLLNCSKFVYITRLETRNTQNGYFSSLRELAYSAPQGSILGPILFLLYITDSPQNVHNVYADDINVLVLDKDLEL
jgi:hypothetical protein